MNTNEQHIHQVQDMLAFTPSIDECIESTLQILASDDSYPAGLTYVVEGIRRVYNDQQHSSLSEHEKQVYDAGFRHSLNQVLCNLLLAEKVRCHKAFRAAYDRTVNLGEKAISDLVSEIRDLQTKMDGLSDDKAGAAQRLQIAERIIDVQNLLFSAILVDTGWTLELADEVSKAILDEHTDETTALLMLSATTLACLAIYDYHKQVAIFEVYKTAANQHRLRLSARAIVGFVLSMSRNPKSLYVAGQFAFFKTLMDDEEDAQALLEVQKCIFASVNAKKDSTLVDQRITGFMEQTANSKFGLEQEEADDKDNVLMTFGPEQGSEFIKGAASLFRTIHDMEQQGADIHFNGFSKMKNFGFFHLLANWFRPFDLGHPAIASLCENREDAPLLLNTICRGMSLCDSDKYSFFLMLLTRTKGRPLPVPQLPEGMDVADVESAVRESLPESIKEYMQDLYRFFDVSTMKDAFDNPFLESGQDEPYCFVARKDMIGDYADEVKTELLDCLLERKDYQRMGSVLDKITMDDESVLAPYHALYHMKYTHDYEKALTALDALKALQPDYPDLAQMYANCLFMLHRYEEAAGWLRQYVADHDDASSPRLRLAYCYIESGQLAEAKQLLYEMEYKTPGRLEVLRMLAWTLLLADELDKAMAITAHKILPLLAQPDAKVIAEDYYNAAVCYLCYGQEQEAIDYLRQYREKAPDVDLNKKLSGDGKLLEHYGVDKRRFNLIINQL